MPEIKLIVSDVDGTLIEKGKNATTPENMRAIERVRQAGIPFTLSSGRAFQAMSRWRESMRLTEPFVCSNGAQIRDEQQVYYSSSFSAEALRSIMALIDKLGFQQYIYSDVKIYCTQKDVNDQVWEIWGKGGMAEDALVVVKSREEMIRETEGNAQKVLGWAPNEVGMNLMLEKARVLGGVAYAVNTLAFDAEFMQPGVTKGSALVHLAEHYGIGVDNILALGDADNDVEMLREAGIGVAMANATPGAKAAADYVVASCGESGLAEAIERFALS